MKARLFFIIAVLASLLAGCAGGNVSGGAIGRHGGGFLSVDQRNGIPMYGGQGYGGVPMYAGQGHQGGIRVPPCQPFNANGLIDWAKGAGDGENAKHQRSASVSNSDGIVHCSSSESASSSSRTGQYGTRQQPREYRGNGYELRNGQQAPPSEVYGRGY